MSHSATDTNIRTGPLALASGLFFTTGATGLIYQVVWMPQLVYVFGATIYAVSAVVAAFMGGLALGSWLAGKWADSLRRPLAVYGVLEILVALAAAVFSWELRALDPLFQWLYDHYGQSAAAMSGSAFHGFSLLRFVLFFCLLLIPTTLMGASLPVLSRYVARRRATIGLRVGSLYTLNTLGAVAGCFLSGFFLIEILGVRNTLFLAVALNLLAGALAVVYGWRDRRDDASEDVPVSASLPEPADRPSYPRWVLSAVLWSYAVSGAVALAYEVVWSRAIVFSMGAMRNTTYAFSAMLTVFLVGLAAGAGLMARIVDRQRDPLSLYALIQTLIGLCGALSLFVILKERGGGFVAGPVFEGATQTWLQAMLGMFLKTMAAIFPPTFAMGMAFPLAARLCAGDPRKVGGHVGRLYALNTMGGIVGAFLGGFVLIPTLGLAGSAMTLALVSVVMGAVLLVAHPGVSARRRFAYCAVGVTMIAALTVRFPEQHRPLHSVAHEGSLVFYEEGPLATVSVALRSSGHKSIYVDGVPVASTSRVMLTDQKSLAHVPMLIAKNPRSALTVGFGSGGSSHSYSLYDELEQVHCAEICPTVLRAAPHLTASNHGIIKPDPDRLGHFTVREDARGRFAVRLDDARSYLRFTRERYDIIATDCTDLGYKANANLYDLEFFDLCSRRIREHGLVVVWMPLGSLSDETFRVALRTFHRVFPHMSVWYMHNDLTHYVLLLGANEPLRIDVAKMKQRLAEPDVRADLAEVGLDSYQKILSCYIVDERALSAFLEGDLLNTENFPYLEFKAPRLRPEGRSTIQEHLNRLWDIHNDVEPYLDNWPGDGGGEEADLLRRYRLATDRIMKAHAVLRDRQWEQATRLYLEARRLCPEDKTIDRLLDFLDLRDSLKHNPNNVWALATLGRCLLIQDRLAEARALLRRAVDLEAQVPQATRETSQWLFDWARSALEECEERFQEVD